MIKAALFSSYFLCLLLKGNSQICIQPKESEIHFRVKDSLYVNFILTNDSKKNFAIKESSFHYGFLVLDSLNNIVAPAEKIDWSSANTVVELGHLERKEIKVWFPEIKNYIMGRNNSYYIQLKIFVKKNDKRSFTIKIVNVP